VAGIDAALIDMRKDADAFLSEHIDWALERLRC